ncbi:MAG TPA: UDP-N-acetylmuramate dehydrogenase [Deltaproteobacteria bacterium]|nr:UDP-N-acetylmuramate dehydrogenase [Deltaproteobacteria bacterium]
MRMMEMVHAAEVTSMHCGGTIARIYEPAGTGELHELIVELGDFHILGGGTNTIFEDTTITRPVIRLGREFAFIEPVPGGVRAGAAVPMKRLLSFCIRNGQAGIEFMAGIPGLLGGALFMNAGTPERGIMDAATEVEVVDRTGIRTIPKADIRYGYRTGGFGEKTVITAAFLRLEPSTREEVRRSVLPHLDRRRGQPHGYSSGSIFRNPPRQAAGQLIDRAGLKGLRAGGAKVSEIHANFIINDRGATTGDIKRLISLIKTRVKDRFGIELREEVKIIGQ